MFLLSELGTPFFGSSVATNSSIFLFPIRSQPMRSLLHVTPARKSCPVLYKYSEEKTNIIFFGKGVTCQIHSILQSFGPHFGKIVNILFVVRLMSALRVRLVRSSKSLHNALLKFEYVQNSNVYPSSIHPLIC